MFTPPPSPQRHKKISSANWNSTIVQKGQQKEPVNDLADLIDLDQESVFTQLKERFDRDLIYTYSGLFLIAINPWKHLDREYYTENIIAQYKGRMRHEMPPHIFSICDEAYRVMLDTKVNQAILITGESGSGKTENTARVIQYFAETAGSHLGTSSPTLEAHILQANPILESFGNAKTIRNNNSSRFGKFVRLLFNPNSGTIIGANFEHYLLEKGRVVFHNPHERNFHIFYQLVAGCDEEMRRKCKLLPMNEYRFLEGTQNINGINDAVEFRSTVAALDAVGFSSLERESVWRILSAILLMGNLEFMAGADHTQLINREPAEHICYLLGLDIGSFEAALMQPTLQAGEFTVTTTLSQEKAISSVHALAKGIYERLFKWIVGKINSNLDFKTRDNEISFIGVLDIAGFEIFEENSFEQLCINLTNEKLQQFFNNRMFVLEQQVYISEEIEWDMIDFGLDLKPTIDLIEQPLGIMSILDEECLFPKATDETFARKLIKQQEKKHPKFDTVRFSPNSFICKHYAGDVQYDTKGWILKNKDPFNENLGRVLSSASLNLISELFGEFGADFSSTYSTQPQHFARKKGSQFVTVSQRYRLQLNDLMFQLQQTTPHFVRCLLPNDRKKPGEIDHQRVLEQLTCNGVLEGVRISRLGYPSRIKYHDFYQRYSILAERSALKNLSVQQKAKEIINSVGLDEESYRFGKTLVLLKDGVLKTFEERLNQRISGVIVRFQARIRGFLVRQKIMLDRSREIYVSRIQRNYRKCRALKEDKWWQLFVQVRPMLAIVAQERSSRQLRKEIECLKFQLLQSEEEKEYLKRQHADQVRKMEEDNEELVVGLEETIQTVARLEDQCLEADSRAKQLELKLEAITNDRDILRAEVASKSELSKDLVESLQQEIEIMKSKLSMLESHDRTASEENQDLHARILQEQQQKQFLEAKLLQNERSLEIQTQKLKSLEASSSKAMDDAMQLLSATQQLEAKLAKKSAEVKNLAIENKNLQAFIDEFKSKATTASEELRVRRERTVSLETEKSSMAVELQKSRDELRLMTEELDDCHEEIVKLRGIISSQSSEINSFKKQHLVDLEDRDSAIHSLQRQSQLQYKKFEDMLERTKTKEEEMKGTFARLDCRIKDLHQQLSSSEQSRLELTRENRKLLQDNKVMENQCETIRKEADRKITSLSESAKREISHLKTEISSLQTSIAEKRSNETQQLQSKIETLKHEVEEYEKQQKYLQNQVAQLESEKDQALSQASGYRHEILEIKKRLKEYESQFDEMKYTAIEKDALNEKFLALSQEHERLAKDYEICKSAAQSLDDASQQVMDHIVSLQKKLEISEKDRESTMASERSSRKKIADLEMSLESVKLELELRGEEKLNAIQLLEHSKSSIDRLTIDNEQLKEQVTELEGRLADVTDDLIKKEQEKSKRLSDKIEELAEQNHILTSKREELISEISELTARCDSLQHSLDEGKSAYKAQINRITENNETRERLEAVIEDLREKVLKSEEKSSLVEAEKAKLHAELEKAKISIRNQDQLETDALNYRQQTDLIVAQMSQELEIFQREYQEYQLKYEKTNKANSDMSVELELLNEKITELKQQLKSAIHENSSLQTKLSLSKTDHEARKKSLEEKDCIIDSLHQEIVQEKAECDKLRQDLIEQKKSFNETLKCHQAEAFQSKQTGQDEVYKLRRENDLISSKLRDVSELLRREQNENKELRQTFQTAQNEISNLKSSLDKNNQLCKSATTELSGLKIRYSALENSANEKLSEAEITEFRYQTAYSDLQEHKRQLMELNSTVRIFKSQNEDLMQHSDEQQSKIQDMERQIYRLSAERSTLKEREQLLTVNLRDLEQLHKNQDEQMGSEIFELQSQIEEARKTNEMLTVSLAETLQEFVDYREERSDMLSRYRKEQERSRKEQRELTDAFKAQKKASLEMETKISNLENEFASVAEELDDTKLKNMELALNFESMFLRKQQLENELTEMHTKLAEESKKLSNISFEYEKLQEHAVQIEEAAFSCDAQKRRIEDLENSLRSANEEIFRFRKNDKKSQEQVNRLQHEVYRLCEEFENIAAIKSKLERENQELVLRLEQSRNELERKFKKILRKMEDELTAKNSSLEREQATVTALKTEVKKLEYLLKQSRQQQSTQLGSSTSENQQSIVILRKKLLEAEHRIAAAELALRKAEQDKENERARVFANFLPKAKNK